jgi:hypothetical protein
MGTISIWLRPPRETPVDRAIREQGERLRKAFPWLDERRRRRGGRSGGRSAGDIDGGCGSPTGLYLNLSNPWDYLDLSRDTGRADYLRAPTPARHGGVARFGVVPYTASAAYARQPPSAQPAMVCAAPIDRRDLRRTCTQLAVGLLIVIAVLAIAPLSRRLN